MCCDLANLSQFVELKNWKHRKYHLTASAEQNQNTNKQTTKQARKPSRSNESVAWNLIVFDANDEKFVEMDFEMKMRAEHALDSNQTEWHKAFIRDIRSAFLDEQ